MTRTVNIHEAKTHLSRLLQDVERGQEVIIARAGHPIARLSRISPPKREFGFDRGRIWISPDFDDPLPEFDDPDPLLEEMAR